MGNLFSLLIYITPPLLSAILMGVISYHTWNRRSARVTGVFAMMTLAIAVWSLAHAFELGLTELEAKIFWAKFKYLGILPIPVAWLVFAVQYNHREPRLTKRKIALLSVVPAISLIAVWSNDAHHLLWKDTVLNVDGSIPILVKSFGVMFWVQAIYAYTLMLIGAWVFMRGLPNAPKIHRSQILTLLVAALIPLLGNILFITGLSPIPNLDLTSAGLTIASLVLLQNLFHYGFLDLVPISRTTLIESMNEGVLVLDNQDRILDLNPAALLLIGLPESELIGHLAPREFRAHTVKVPTDPNATRARIEILWDTPTSRYLDLSISPLHDTRGRLTGKLLILQDISEQKRIEKTLRHYNNRLNILHGIDRAIIDARSLEDAALSAIAQLHRSIPCQQISLHEINLAANQVNTLAQIFDGQKTSVSKKPVLASIAEINPILLRGKIEIESDLYEKSSLNRFEKRLQAEGMCAYVNAPLLTQGKLIGTLSLAANTPDAFSEINIEIIREAAHQLAIAIQSTRLLEETRRRALHLQVGAEIARDIARAKDLDELINTAVNLVRDRFGFYHAGIFLVDEKREYAVLKAATGKAGQKMLEHGHQLKVGEVGIVGYVTGTGTPRIALDVGADAVHFKNPFLPETRSEMALPLKIGTHVIGALDVQSKQPAAFDNDDIATLHTMADQLTIAFENTRLYLTATRRADELNVLMRLGHAISANLNLNTILETTYQCVGNLMPNDAFWIASYKSGDTHYHYLLKIDQEIRYSFPDHSSIEKGLGGCTIQNKTPMRFNSRSEPRPFTQVHYGDSTPVESVICVPLLLGGQVIGAMSTQSYTPNAFTQSELNLLQKLAEPVAIALQNSQLFEATRRQLEELTLLHAIANAGTEATTEDTLIERVTTIIGNTLYPTYPGRPDNFGIMMVDEDAGVVKTHPSYRGIHSICQIGDGITGKVAQDGLPRLLADVRKDPDYLNVDPDIKSELCVPIKAGERVIGIINAENAELNSFTSTDQRLLTTVADQLATAIQKARLFAKTREALTREQRLNEISRTISKALNLPTILPNVVRLAAELVGAEAGALHIIGDGDEIMTSYFYNVPKPWRTTPVKGRGLVWQIHHNSEAILLDDYKDHPKANVSWNEMGAKAFIGVPLISGQTHLGALGLFSKDPRRRFTERDLALTETIGQQAGIAIENARLFSETQSRADELALALEKQEELDRLKSEFIQNVSHELRTPIAIIRGYAELLNSGELGELDIVYRDPIATITRRSHMLSKLVDDLSAILDAEQQAFTRKRFDLSDLMETMVAEFEDPASKARLELHANVAQDLPLFRGDPTHIRRVIDNLLGNALKFTPRGGRVDVSLIQRDGFLILTVSDTGIGIPKKEHSRIFDRFYQVDGSMSRRYGGTGLGLSLVKQIVDSHQGTIDLTSEEGEGTTFTIKFPIKP